MTTLFHTTTPDVADSILRGGFRGSSGSYGFASTWFEDVVFLARDPASVSDGAKGEVVLAVDVGDLDLTEYAIVEDRGRGPEAWEYAVPADLLNRLPPGSVSVDD